MSDSTIIEHFRNLVSLSVADGKIHEAERTTLSRIAGERGIPQDRLGVMFKHAHEYKYLIPQNQKEREKQLDEMIDLAMVDGEFAEAEFELIMMVSEKLGFTREETERLINDHPKSRGLQI